MKEMRVIMVMFRTKLYDVWYSSKSLRILVFLLEKNHLITGNRLGGNNPKLQQQFAMSLLDAILYHLLIINPLGLFPTSLIFHKN